MIYFLISIPVCTLTNFQIFLGLLIPFILGTLLGWVLNAGKKSIQQELEKTQLDLQQSVANNAAIRSEFETTLTDHKNLKQSEIKDLQSRLSEMENTHASLQSELNQSHERLKSFEGQDFEGLKSKLLESENSHNLLKIELENLLNHKTHLENQVSSLEAVQENFNALKTDYHQALSENEKLKSEGQKQEFTIHNVPNPDLESLNLELENLKKEAESTHARHAEDSINWISEMENLRLKHHEDFESLKNEARGIISTHVEEIEKWKKEAEESQSHLAELREKLNLNRDMENLNDCKAQNELLLKEIDELKSKIAALESEIEGKPILSHLGSERYGEAHENPENHASHPPADLIEEPFESNITHERSISEENFLGESQTIQEENTSFEPPHYPRGHSIETPTADLESNPENIRETLHIINPTEETLIYESHSLPVEEDIKTDSGLKEPEPENSHESFIGETEHNLITQSGPIHTIEEGEIRNKDIYQEPNYYFRLKGYDDANEVYLVGDFENWAQNRYLMHREGGEWVFPIHLDRGKYLYKFIVDGEWILDPANSFTEENIFGTGNSVVFIM